MIQLEGAGMEKLGNGVVVIENTEIMNKKFEFSFMFLTIPFGFLAIMLNMKVLATLWKKEKTTVNQLMSIDSFLNIVFACLCTFQQSPYFRGLDWEIYCNFHIAVYYVCGMFNSLCPLAIVYYR